MKINTLIRLCISLLVMSVLNACKGPAGDVGPQGATGTTGATGATGTIGAKGDPGNANVVYSEWKTPIWDGLVYDYTASNGFVTLANTSTADALLTKDAINTAAIYTYIKYTTIVYDQPSQTYSTIDRVTSAGTVYSYFKIPGRTTSKFEDFSYTYINCTEMGENYFAPYAYLYTATYNSTQQKYVPIPELAGKLTDVYKALVKNTPQIRQVVVYGSVKSGRLATINWQNYTEVKQVLNLKD